jgi:hypothetical protein
MLGSWQVQIFVLSRHNYVMSDQEKPILEEDAKIARILGAILMIALPLWGFYASSALGKEWYFDYRIQDLPVALRGAGYMLILAFGFNVYIWFRYKSNVDKDTVNEWYDPQAGHDHH